MTDKQRNLIIYLDNLCKEKGVKMRASDDELLGQGWFIVYRNITFEYTNEVIEKMKKALNMPITKKARKK